MAESRLIRMVRSAEQAQGGPTQADVHPAEVEQYKAAGFTVAEEAQPKPARQKTAPKPKE